jgi:hypothetical protein
MRAPSHDSTVAGTYRAPGPVVTKPESLARAARPVVRARCGQVERPPRVGQELRVVEPLRRARQRHGVAVRGERGELGRHQVVLEVVVIVAQEEGRHGAKEGAVQLGDLRADGALEDRLVRGP